MPENEGQQGYTVRQAADMLYSGLKNPDPKYNDLRKIANQLKQQGNGKISDRDFVLHAREANPTFKKINILDLTEPPPASTSKVSGGVKAAVSAAKENKTLSKVLDIAKLVVGSNPAIAAGVAATKHPFTPLSEQLLGPGRNLEAAVRAGNKRGQDATAGLPSAVTAIPRFAQELVARGAATVDQIQTPAGMASIVLAATPIGGALGKAMPWLQKMATTAIAGTKAWDVVGDVADMADKGVSAEALARTGYDALEGGLALVGMKGAGKPAAAEVAAKAVPGKFEAWRDAHFTKDPSSGMWQDKAGSGLWTGERLMNDYEKHGTLDTNAPWLPGHKPPALPPGTDVATIPKSATVEERQMKEMPVQALRGQAEDLLRKMRGVHGETSPYKTDAERIRASSTLQQRLATINKHIVDKGGTPVNVPPPAPGGPSMGKINLQHEAGKTSTGLPPGVAPPKKLPSGQYEMPGNRGELGPGEQTQYGPKTADRPNEFTNQKASRIAQDHGVKPDDVLEMSRQSNQDLRDATNQLIHLRAQLHATGSSATYIDQLTNHINAMTEVLLERDRVTTAPPPGRNVQ